jgi:hypothetical protein
MRLLTIPIVLAVCIGVTATSAGRGRAALRVAGLSRYGLTITLPSGWQGRIYKRRQGLPVFHAGNFRLPFGDDDGGTKAIKTMGKSSVLIVLLESEGTGGAHFRRLSAPPQVRRNDFLAMFEGVPPSHAFARVLFTTRRRYFQVWVQFGIRPAPAGLLRQANHVLATLRIGPA